ncbi:MAG: PIN domain-containing protein [Candidatus Thorarchaeota archaeon]
MRAYLDANFFISGFSERPKDVFLIKEAAEKIGIELWITRQVFQELRWYLRREVEQIIEIDETLKKDIKELIESIKRPESSLPQPNDMSLILAAMRSKNSRIVTSDLKLLNTIQDLKLNVEGIVGSAFVLELMESQDDESIKKKLLPVRERIYGEEVRYSISRSEAYDPVTRIRIIEEHAMRVLREVKRPAGQLDSDLTRGQPLFVLDFLEDIKAGIPTMFDDFTEGKYDTLAREIEAVQTEIERLLIVSTRTEDSETHGKLVNPAADLTLFLYYLEMICHLYRGTREGVEDALAISDEAFRLLMFTGVKDDALKASVFFVRIVIALIREDYDEIDYYYSLYDSLLNRLGLDDMKETSEGLYVTMQILRKFMGGFSLTKNKLDHPDVTIAMLNDIAKYAIQFDDHENAWQLAETAYKIGVAYGKEDAALSSFLMLYKVSSSSHDKLKVGLEKYAEHALKFFVKKGWSTASITPILNEVQGNITPIDVKTSESPVLVSKLPVEFQGWMDVLSIENINGIDILVVRNEQLQVRVGIDISQHPALKSLKTGHKIALTKGKFSLTETNEAIRKKYAVLVMITPSKTSEISYEGVYGFSYLKVAEPE